VVREVCLAWRIRRRSSEVAGTLWSAVYRTEGRRQQGKSATGYGGPGGSTVDKRLNQLATELGVAWGPNG